MKAFLKSSLSCLSRFPAMAANGQQKKNTISHKQTPVIAAGKNDTLLAIMRYPDRCVLTNGYIGRSLIKVPPFNADSEKFLF